MPATWTAEFTPLTQSDPRARGVANMVAVLAKSGSRIIKTTIPADRQAEWDPEKAWRS